MLNATIDSSHDDPAPSAPETAPTASTEDAAPEAPPPRRIVLQFFLGPLLIVLLCALVVGIWQIGNALT